MTQQSEVSRSLPITVRATVTMGRWAHRGHWRRLSKKDRMIVAECLELLEITSIADRLIGTLSGGQRQRALVAQGLAQQAGLLLLDEPSAGLDLHARGLIDQALGTTLTRGTTVLRVTHDLEVAGRADHCLLLQDGKLVGQGEPASVLTPERVAAAWGLAGPRPATRSRRYSLERTGEATWPVVRTPTRHRARRSLRDRVGLEFPPKSFTWWSLMDGVDET